MTENLINAETAPSRTVAGHTSYIWSDATKYYSNLTGTRPLRHLPRSSPWKSAITLSEHAQVPGGDWSKFKSDRTSDYIKTCKSRLFRTPKWNFIHNNRDTFLSNQLAYFMEAELAAVESDCWTSWQSQVESRSERAQKAATEFTAKTSSFSNQLKSRRVRISAPIYLGLFFVNLISQLQKIAQWRTQKGQIRQSAKLYHQAEGKKSIRSVDPWGIEPQTFRSFAEDAKRTRYHCAKNPDRIAMKVMWILKFIYTFEISQMLSASHSSGSL